MKGIFLVISIFICNLCFAQSDTSIVYYNKDGKETMKDSALSYAKFAKSGNLWYGKAYISKGDILKSEGSYAEKSFNTPVGSFKNYNDKGALDNVSEYANGKAVQRTWYYKNGDKRAWIFYDEKGQSQQKGWDESGKEIRNYVVEREARFKGGPEGWRKFLEKTLNANVATESGAPVGDYKTKLQFIVSKEGYISNVKAVEVPAGCKPCAKEAVAVLANSPAWEPAIQNNIPVIYQAIQFITFQVAEEKKKGRKN